MLWERILSAVIGIILVIFFILWGSLPFAILIALMAVLASNEYSRMLPINDKNNRLLLILFSIIVILYTYLSNRGVINLSRGLFFTIALFFLFVYHIFYVESADFLQRLGFNLIGITYIAGGLTFFVLLRDFPIHPFDNTAALWLALLATWAEDTGAYFIGSKFGKTKFISKSPNKSVEGALGGIAFTIIIISIYIYFVATLSWQWIVYAVLAAVVAMLGDLFESSIKRFSGVKDSGKLIPGHGGVLDRLDSLLFSIPFTYFFLHNIL